MTNEEVQEKVKETLNQLLIEIKDADSDQVTYLRSQLREIINNLGDTFDEDMYDSYGEYYDSSC